MQSFKNQDTKTSANSVKYYIFYNNKIILSVKMIHILITCTQTQGTSL